MLWASNHSRLWRRWIPSRRADKRVTTGPNFALVGGSRETHEVMTEKAIRINEKLSAKGKRLEQVSHEEFDDIAASVGLHRCQPQER